MRADTMTRAERISEIEAILQAGTTTVRHGDRVVQYDLEALRKERDRLLAIESGGGSSFRRVTFRNA